MSETTFRSAPPVSEHSYSAPKPPPEPSKVAPGVNPDDFSHLEPIEDRESRGKDIVLESLGIEENLHDLPSEDKQNIAETNAYIKSIIRARGIEPTIGNFKEVLEDIKSDMGLDKNVAPDVLLERIAGVVTSWKDLSFLKDAREKRSIFSKLMRAETASEMHRIVFEEMQRRSVWQ